MSWFGPVAGQIEGLEAARTLFGKQKLAGKIIEHKVFEERVLSQNRDAVQARERRRLHRLRKQQKKKYNIPCLVDKKLIDSLKRKEKALKLRAQGKMGSWQIAHFLGVDPKTVRRWFRSNPL